MPWYIIGPGSKFKSFWNILILLLLLYEIIWFPFSLAFLDENDKAL